MLSVTRTSGNLCSNICAEADTDLSLIKSHTLLHKTKKTPEDLKGHPRERKLLARCWGASQSHVISRPWGWQGRGKGGQVAEET